MNTQGATQAGSIAEGETGRVCVVNVGGVIIQLCDRHFEEMIQEQDIADVTT